MQEKPESKSQLASFQYLVEQPSYAHEWPYWIFDDVPKGTKRGNLVIKNGPEQFVEDVRNSEEEFHLDVQGFTFKENSFSEPIEWNRREDIEQKYIPSVKALLKDVLGEDIVYCESICYRLRDGASGQVLREDEQYQPTMTYISPAFQLHVDYSALEAFKRMQNVFGEQADELVAKHRLRLINVWRPLVDVVEDLPLAICDARHANPEDLIEVAFIDGGIARYNYMGRYSDNYRFCYLSNMHRDEVCILKNFDSRDGVAKRAPHCSFKSKFASPKSSTRQSVEVRLLVLSNPA
ncbi:conserved hypothetical protein [Talaromyces stipitatus ATCC 10500]|uniref:Methyltransferase n=1 Tax=Talaromyces stipitatus (strain ATCC 10500 / CBS 375.48 / QM 6759 / NRRL 1006) TaxID=441959 RepID=B8MSK0_TALSN|nr:uncharacterized protein TSTA_001510 [Talaromyces stipitatus ATCC 10500]EED12080.1 conserved hypothetical protein [Talaromyces stipitatus ATCC 10500]